MTREQVRRELSREIGANAASAVTEVLGLRALAAKHAREHASVVQILQTHQGQSNLILSGDASLNTAREQTRLETFNKRLDLEH